MEKKTKRAEVDLNRKSWEQAIKYHNLAKGNIARAISENHEGILFPEIAKLIPRTNNLRFIQLFCNDGRELLSIIKHRAKGVGVDFSSNAIALAMELNKNLNYECSFYCNEVMDWLHSQPLAVGDICFTSLGSLWWVSDLKDYFNSIYKIVSPKGYYVMWDFHPFVHTLSDELQINYSYPFPRTKRFHKSGIVDYVTNPEYYYLAARRKVISEKFINPFPVYDYIWSMSAIVDAAVTAGWRIKQMTEYPYISGEKYLTGLVKKRKFMYTTKLGSPALPLTFSLVLVKD